MEKPLVSGIAFSRDEAKITLAGVPDTPGVAARILAPIGSANIEVDVIVQNVGADNTIDLTFTVNKGDMKAAVAVLQEVAKEIGARDVRADDEVAKVSIVGVGMRSHAGVASKMFTALDRKSTRLNSSHVAISYAVFCLKKKK